MTRSAVLSDEMWEQIEPLLPPLKGPMGRPMRDHRLLVEGAIYHYRTGIPWRDLPADFGPWQTVWKRHHRFALDGTWDRMLTALHTAADAAGGRPVSYDTEDYKGRNTVERAFNVLKNWRGLATRYDKHAVTYRAGLVLAAVLTWLQ